VLGRCDRRRPIVLLHKRESYKTRSVIWRQTNWKTDREADYLSCQCRKYTDVLGYLFHNCLLVRHV